MIWGGFKLSAQTCQNHQNIMSYSMTGQIVGEVMIVLGAVVEVYGFTGVI